MRLNFKWIVLLSLFFEGAKLYNSLEKTNEIIFYVDNPLLAAERLIQSLNVMVPLVFPGCNLINLNLRHSYSG